MQVLNPDGLYLKGCIRKLFKSYLRISPNNLSYCVLCLMCLGLDRIIFSILCLVDIRIKKTTYYNVIIFLSCLIFKV